MMNIFILGSVGIFMVIIGLFWMTFSYGSRFSRVLVYCGNFIAICAIAIFCVADSNREFERKRRTFILIGSAVEVPEVEAKTADCIKSSKFSFKFRYREGKIDKRLPYTFEVSCDTVLLNGDVLRITFVAPKNADGKPEVLELINFTYEIEKYSAPAPLLEMLEAK